MLVKEIEEAAFKRASAAALSTPYAKSPIYTAKRRETARIATFVKSLTDYLNRCIDVAKTYYSAPEFYKQLVSLYFSKEKINENYKRLRGILRLISELSSQYISQIKYTNDNRELSLLRKEALGRLSSIIKRRRDVIEFFRDIYVFAHKLPSISPDLPLIVVAGPPNVGKSSLVRIISTAKPKVAEYPFTTKTISVGHFKIDNNIIQIMDTPGLLDRPMEERNEIEKQAILALNLMADSVIYMFDPSPFRYYPIDIQLKILLDIEKYFKKLKIIKVVNKIDIKEIDIPREIGDTIEISALTGYGINNLIKKIRDTLML